MTIMAMLLSDDETLATLMHWAFKEVWFLVEDTYLS